MAETRGTTELRRAGIDHRLMAYAYAGGGAAERAAEALDVAPERMFKSLVARAGDDLVFALLPATSELSLSSRAWRTVALYVACASSCPACATSTLSRTRPKSKSGKVTTGPSNSLELPRLNRESTAVAA